MKKILAIILTCVVVLSLVGCAEVINTETETVKATIVEVDRDPMRVTLVGKVMVTHPADYDILLKYEDIEAWVDVSRDEYDKYETLIGSTVDAKLTTVYYDDDTTKEYLELMEE